MAVSGPESSAFRVIDVDRFFLKKGQMKTISLEVEDNGTLDGVPARAVARLNTLSLEAPN